MRYLITLDSTAGGRAQNIPFSAAYILILNPTAKTLYVRVGGNDIPQTPANASIVCPAAYAMAWPVNGTAYGLGFGLPQLAIQPDGLPTTATVCFFDASEQLPAFGPMPLDTLQAAITNTVAVDITNANINATITNSNLNATITNSNVDVIGFAPIETVMRSAASRAPGVYTDTLTLPAGTRGVVIEPVGGTGTVISALTVTGHQSGLVYLSVNPQDHPNTSRFVCPVYQSSDSGVDVAVTLSGTGSDYAALALGDRPLLESAQDGPLLVRNMPEPRTATKVGGVLSLSVPPGTGLTPAFLWTFAAPQRLRYRAGHVYCDGAALNTVVVILSVLDANGVEQHRLLEVVGYPGTPQAKSEQLPDPGLTLPAGYQIRGAYLNGDTVAHTISVTAVAEAYYPS